jgi:hypothetical protein
VILLAVSLRRKDPFKFAPALISAAGITLLLL